MHRFALISWVVLAVLLPGAASAQTDRRVGITLGYPAQVGVLWNVTNRVAVRPEVSLSTGSTESEIQSQLIGPGVPPQISTSISQTDFTTISAELNVLVALKSWDALELYAAPSYAYGRSSSTFETSTMFPSSPEITRTIETINRMHSVTGSLGVQFTPHERFTIFGESGLRYSSTTSAATTEFRSRTVGTVGAAGVVFYF